MKPSCPKCESTAVKKNGHIHNGKQNHRCLVCGRQFVLNPQQKIIPDQTKNEVRQALLERVSLEGVCRIFSVSMPWLLGFIHEIISELPDDLNVTLSTKNKDFEVVLSPANHLNQPHFLYDLEEKNLALYLQPPVALRSLSKQSIFRYLHRTSLPNPVSVI